VKLIPILISTLPLLAGQTNPDPAPRMAYLVTRASSAEAKALFSAKLVRMNASKFHWYEDSSVVRVEISSKALTDLQTDPDVELVFPEREQAPPSGPQLPPAAPEAKPISCAAALPPANPALAVPLPVLPAPVLPNMPPPMAPGGMMIPPAATPMASAFGLADALAGGVAQKLLNRPPSCKVSLIKHQATYPGRGGEGLIEVNASGSCAWQAQASVGWITILSGSGVSGSGIISYHVAPGEGLARSASIWIVATPGGTPIKGKASQVVTQNK
jgi:hypothetical protein